MAKISFWAMAGAVALLGTQAACAQASMVVKPEKYCDNRVQLTQFTRSFEKRSDHTKIHYSAWVKNLTDSPVTVSAITRPVQAGLRDITAGGKLAPAHKSILLRFAEWEGIHEDAGEGLSDYVLSKNVTIVCAR